MKNEHQPALDYAREYADFYDSHYGDLDPADRPAHQEVCAKHIGNWVAKRYGREPFFPDLWPIDPIRRNGNEQNDREPGAATGATTGAAAGAGDQIPTQEGIAVSAGTGETTTLSQTIASIEAWEAETQNAMGSLELSMASLEGAEVGPSVTGAIAEAREAFAAAAAAFAKAKGALEPSQQIGDMYNSAPDAGSKEFVKS